MPIVSVPSLSIFCASIPCIRFPSNVHQSLSLRHLSHRCLLTPSCLKTYYTVSLYYLHLLYSYVAVGASNSKSILNCRALNIFFFYSNRSCDQGTSVTFTVSIACGNLHGLWKTLLFLDIWTFLHWFYREHRTDHYTLPLPYDFASHLYFFQRYMNVDKCLYIITQYVYYGKEGKMNQCPW